MPGQLPSSTPVNPKATTSGTGKWVEATATVSTINVSTSLWQRYLATVGQAAQEIDQGNREKALELLDDCQIAYRAWEWHCLRSFATMSAKADGEWNVQIANSGKETKVRHIVFSPVEGTFAVEGSHQNQKKNQYFLELWKIGEQKSGRALEGWVVGFNSDGSTLITQDFRIWDADSGKLLEQMEMGVPQRPRRQCLGFIGDTPIALSNTGRTVELRDPRGGNAVAILDVGSVLPTKADILRYVENARLDPTQTRIAVELHCAGPALKNSRPVLQLWELASGKKQLASGKKRLELRSNSPVVFSSDGKLGGLAHFDGTFAIYDSETGVSVADVNTRGSGTRFTPDSKRLVSWSGRRLNFYDVATGAEIPLTLQGNGEIQHASFSPDGRWLVAAGAGGWIRAWRVDVSEQTP